MQKILLHFFLEEIFIFFFVAFIYKYLKNKGSVLKSIGKTFVIIALIDFINITILLLNIQLCDLNKQENYFHYAFKFEEYVVGDFLYTKIYIEPYIGFVEKSLKEFSINRFYSKYGFTLLKIEQVSDSLFHRINKNF